MGHPNTLADSHYVAQEHRTQTFSKRWKAATAEGADACAARVEAIFSLMVEDRTGYLADSTCSTSIAKEATSATSWCVRGIGRRREPQPPTTRPSAEHGLPTCPSTMRRGRSDLRAAATTRTWPALSCGTRREAKTSTGRVTVGLPVKDKKETRARSSRPAITTEAARASSEQIARTDNGQAGEPSRRTSSRDFST